MIEYDTPPGWYLIKDRYGDLTVVEIRDHCVYPTNGAVYCLSYKLAEIILKLDLEELTKCSPT